MHIGYTDIYNTYTNIGLLDEDRKKHLFLLGKSGFGKTHTMIQMALQDIYTGKGVIFIDPQGWAAHQIVSKFPQYRAQDLIYFDPSHLESCVGLNILESTDPHRVNIAVSEVMTIFKFVFKDAWSARMEYILINSLRLLMLDDDAHSLLGVLKIFSDEKFAQELAQKCNDSLVKTFWLVEYKNFPANYKTEAIAAIQNKVGQILLNNVSRNILGQSSSTVNFEDIVNGKKILICNFSKGVIGSDVSKLLGTIVLSKLLLAVSARARNFTSDFAPCYVYIDEIYNFLNDSFIGLLTDAGKYNVNITFSAQYIKQLEIEKSDIMIRSIFGTVGSIITFCLGIDDAEVVGKEFALENVDLFLKLEVGQTISKLLIEGRQTTPFVAFMYPVLFEEMRKNPDTFILHSNTVWTKPSTLVSQEIEKYYHIPEKDNAKSRRKKARDLKFGRVKV